MPALGALGTGLAFVLMGTLVARVGATRAAFAIYLVPVVAMVLGAVFLDEVIYAISVVGIALVLTGAFLASRKDTPGPVIRQPEAPILEFDPAPSAVIEPGEVIEPIDVPPHVVLCFFQDVIATVVEELDGRVIDHVVSEIGRNPVYEVDAGRTAPGHRASGRGCAARRRVPRGTGGPRARGPSSRAAARACSCPTWRWAMSSSPRRRSVTRAPPITTCPPAGASPPRPRRSTRSSRPWRPITCPS